jgi:FlaA1/EpsC-like NDP-sugar epimerase
MFEDKTILITGGTGSLGNAITERLMREKNPPKKIIIFSRDEAKQYAMRLRFQNLLISTTDITYSDFERKVNFIIGDIRDYHSVRQAIRGVDIIFHAAAIKQVPTGEYFPYETVKTNVTGAENIVSAIVESNSDVECVVGVSTDKACHPTCAYGMTKSLMERILISANIRYPSTRFILTRYGNVVGSTGSVLPLFKNQVDNKKSLTVTSSLMTRYMMDIQQSVDTIFSAYKHGGRGDIYVPSMPSARIIDVAILMASKANLGVDLIGVRPGEKLYEMLISEEEMKYTTKEKDGYVIHSMLPELCGNINGIAVSDIIEYTSKTDVLTIIELEGLLERQGYL